MATLIELNPNRLLLDSNFDGYKLSLKEVPTKKCYFNNKVDRVLLNFDQYSYLHARLFGLHNHLIADEFDENGSVYFIDEDWNVNKVSFESLSNQLCDPIKVWQIPKSREQRSGDYNVSMKFISPDLVLICDGTGFLYILQTGCRDNDDKFILSFSAEVAGLNEAFLLLDAVLNPQKTNQELHFLSISIKQENPNAQNISLLHWITLTLENGIWSQTALKQIRTKGVIHYAAIEKDCETIYVISNNECNIILNADNTIVNKENQSTEEEIRDIYEWSQTTEDITIHIKLPENHNKQFVYVKPEPINLNIKYENNNYLSGSLYQRIDPNLTNWSIKDNKLEVVLGKQETGLIWPELIVGDNTGKYNLDPSIVDQVNQQLAHRSNEEVTTQAGKTFNSQEVEDCDFVNDTTVTFVRINGNANKITHKIILGSPQVLMTAKLHRSLPPAIGIRYDVDICLWQPNGSKDEMTITHEGTLLALAYVQSSKQNRKFVVCPPSMEYSAICESSGHIFIYRQKKSIRSSELRHRTTGRRVQNIAEQQVLNVTNDEILGIHPLDNKLFLLCNNYIMLLKL